MLCICKKEALGFESLNKHVKSKKKMCILWFGIAVPYLSHVRYIFIFFIWTHGEAELKKFMEVLNNFSPNLEFTYESSKKRVAFLDLNVSLENGSVTTDLHTKSTDCHQYLHCSSSHPDHIKNSIIYSQTLRLSNICTYDEDFDKHALNMKSWFLERRYSKQMIDSQMEKVKFGQRLKAGSKQADFGVPFVIITYHPKQR